MSTLSVCPVCQHSEVELCVERDAVPVFQNAVYDTIAEAQAVATGQLRIVCCKHCGFGRNQRFDPALITYSPAYENDQTISDVFADHMASVADHILAQLSVPTTIAEVGCGQGQFLSILQQRSQNELTCIGFDPAYHGGNTSEQVTIYRDLFTPETANAIGKEVSYVVSRHVIEHVQDPVAFLRNIRDVMHVSEHARLFIETPCVEWILDNHVIQDFFYEHCAYFTRDTLALCMELAGFEVDTITHMFEGQYLLATAKPVQIESNQMVAGETPLAHTAPLLTKIRDYRAALTEEKHYWSQMLATTADMRIAVWGAGAKGTTFVETMDPHRELFKGVIDINPRKQGKYIGLTGHPIYSPHRAAQEGITHIIIMNPNYRDEIRQYLEREHIDMHIIEEKAYAL